MSWYYAGDDRKPNGPVSREKLERLFDEGVLSRHSFVIKEGADQWQRFGALLDEAADVGRREREGASFPYDPEIHGPEAGARLKSGRPSLAPKSGIYSVEEGQGVRAHPVDATEYGMPKSNVMALTGLGLGIFSLTVGWCCFANVVTAPAGLATSMIGYMQVNNSGGTEKGKRLAIGGFMTSLLTIIIWIIIIIAYAVILFTRAPTTI